MTRSPFLSLLSLSLLACALPACGGGSSGGEGGSAGNTNMASSGGSGGAPGTGGSSGGSVSSGGSPGTGGSVSSGGSPGTGGSPSGESVACDDLSCALPGTVCCQNYNEPAACIAPDGDCTYGVPLACDGPEDCEGGQVCCATLYTKGVGNAYDHVECAATCTGKDFRVVCGASGQCPDGKTCGTSDILPPYMDCK